MKIVYKGDVSKEVEDCIVDSYLKQGYSLQEEVKEEATNEIEKPKQSKGK